MGKKIRKISVFVCVALFVSGVFLFGEAHAKSKHYTELLHDNKVVKIKVPNSHFLTDGVNYSLYSKSSKDRWSVQTSLNNAWENRLDEAFAPHSKFKRLKTKRLSGKYMIEYQLKSMRFSITIICTSNYKKFFESLKEKDFVVENIKKEPLEEREKVLATYHAPKNVIKEQVLSQVDFSGYQNTEKIERVQELVSELVLDEAFVKDKKLVQKRQKKGVLLADRHLSEGLDYSLVRQMSLYLALGYEPLLHEREENLDYFVFQKGKKVLPIILIRVPGSVKGEELNIVYVLKKGI